MNHADALEAALLAVKRYDMYDSKILYHGENGKWEAIAMEDVVKIAIAEYCRVRGV